MEFPVTSWTLLAQATLRGDPTQREAMDRLCRDYWKPVCACIAARGAPSDRVEDLTQDFFLQLMTKGFFRKADPAKGRFRSFLLGSLTYFLADDAARTATQRRGGHLQRAELEDWEAATPAEAAFFDREWARALVRRAMAAMEEVYVAARGEKAWQSLRDFLPGGKAAESYATLADLLGMSEGGAKTEVFRLRQRFRDTIRREVARTVSAPHQIEEELAHLQAALAVDAAA
jgi:DNA-directed RNA polymerase specialized sigma24 family protein